MDYGQKYAGLVHILLRDIIITKKQQLTSADTDSINIGDNTFLIDGKQKRVMYVVFSTYKASWGLHNHYQLV